MTNEELDEVLEALRGVDMDCPGAFEEDARKRGVLRGAILKAVEAERERCAALAEAQDFYPGTNRGERQAWVRAEIARKIREG